MKAFFYILLHFTLLCVCTLHLTAQADKGNGKITVASCQFPVSADIQQNLHWIAEQMIEAKTKKATIVHFPECALSGYPGTDMTSLDNFNWKELGSATDSVASLAKKLEIWVVLGSMHRLSGRNKPYNSLYLITPEGVIADRYDKRFCTSTDLEYFTPGDHFVNFTLNGVSCGLLICYDVRFPELYRGYSALGTRVIFQSFYNAKSAAGSIHPLIMPVTAQANAASNYFYMSLTNSSAPESWPCHFLTPDGLIQNKLEKNIPGILISVIDTSVEYYDASGEFRRDAIKGKLNSGKTVVDTLSGRKLRSY
ncbi:MAG: carbon-nitrogen hydrolase family protein [Chitinophagaceae bacterium]|nr:carbon-nitrogen hydrolase family protein [Chitinophagaceae bacterium]